MCTHIVILQLYVRDVMQRTVKQLPQNTHLSQEPKQDSIIIAILFGDQIKYKL